MRAYLAILIMLWGIMSMSGCVSTKEYPQNWAPGYPSTPSVWISSPLREDVCDLTGSYINKGESAPGHEGPEPVSLSRILFGDRVGRPSGFAVVTFRGPQDGSLEVLAWNGRTPVATMKLTREHAGETSSMAQPYCAYQCLPSGVLFLRHSMNLLVELRTPGSAVGVTDG
jgi:hypothetical protein